jgi:hypothetical protein
MILEKLWELLKVQRIEDPAAEPLAFKQRPKNGRILHIGYNKLPGPKENLQQGRSEPIQAILKIDIQIIALILVTKLLED